MCPEERREEAVKIKLFHVLAEASEGKVTGLLRLWSRPERLVTLRSEEAEEETRQQRRRTLRVAICIHTPQRARLHMCTRSHVSLYVM